MAEAHAGPGAVTMGGMTPTCPACGAPLSTDDARCARCGLLLVGPVAAELGAIDRQLAALAGRRRLLLEWLRHDGGAPVSRAAMTFGPSSAMLPPACATGDPAWA